MLYPEDINYNKLNGILSIKTVYLIYTRLLVYAILILAYSKGPCVYLKVNMYKICYEHQRSSSIRDYLRRLSD